jgi:GTP cyclohydrolase I
MHGYKKQKKERELQSSLYNINHLVTARNSDIESACIHHLFDCIE